MRILKIRPRASIGKKAIFKIGLQSRKTNEEAGRALPETENSREELERGFLKSQVLLIRNETAD